MDRLQKIIHGIRVLAFDVDNVLFYDKMMPQIGGIPTICIKEGLRKIGIPEIQISMLLMNNVFPVGQDWTEGVEQRILSKLDIEPDQNEEAIQAISYFYRQYQIKHGLLQKFQGIDQVIKKLSDRFILATISNNCRGNIASGLGNLQKVFQENISYECVDHLKPHPEGIELTCQKLGINRNQLIYVGDNESDMAASIGYDIIKGRKPDEKERGYFLIASWSGSRDSKRLEDLYLKGCLSERVIGAFNQVSQLTNLLII